MNISLTPELERFVSNKVESGLYTSASEVVREGLRLLAKNEARPSFVIESPADLLEKLQAGIDSLDAGKGIPAEDVFSELKELSQGQKSRTHGES